MSDSEKVEFLAGALRRVRSAVLWSRIAATPDDAPLCDWDMEPMDPQTGHADCLAYLESYRAWASRRRAEMDEILDEAGRALESLGLPRDGTDGGGTP